MMKEFYHSQVKSPRARALVGIVLVLAMVNGLVVVADTFVPPTWTPPQLYIEANDDNDSVALGDRFDFYITVTNPATPPPGYEIVVPWYQVQVMDEIDPRLSIVEVSTLGKPVTVQIVSNTVLLQAASLEPGEWFMATVQCEVVGPADPGDTVDNVFSVTYEDEEGTSQGPIFSNTETVTIVGRVLLPIIIRNY